MLNKNTMCVVYDVYIYIHNTFLSSMHMSAYTKFILIIKPKKEKAQNAVCLALILILVFGEFIQAKMFIDFFLD